MMIIWKLQLTSTIFTQAQLLHKNLKVDLNYNSACSHPASLPKPLKYKMKA